MAQLCHHQAEIERLNTEVLIISFGGSPLARSWLQENGAVSRGKLLLDPGREVYRAYGLERSWLRSWNWRTVWQYAQLLANGRRWRGVQGDSAQLGGDFVVDAGGVVRLAHRSHDPTDRPPVAELLALLRLLEDDRVEDLPRQELENQ